jgi:hypothetical protein
MKGFSEFRGLMLRMSFDAVSGEFVNVVVPHSVAQNLSTESLATKPEENFKPKIVSRSQIKRRDVETQALRKKRA